MPQKCSSWPTNFSSDKTCKERSSTSFSPPFKLSLFVDVEAPQCQGGLHFLCCYGIGMISNMMDVSRSRHASWDPAHFLVVSLYLQLLLTQKELSMCSRSLVTSSVTSTMKHFALVVLFVSILALEVPAVDFLYSLCPADIVASREKFCASFFFGSMTSHCPSSCQILAIQRLWRRWATFSQKVCPSFGYVFPCRTTAHRRRQACMFDHHCKRSNYMGQPTKCIKPVPWSAVSS